jgi:hypothetical protein
MASKATDRFWIFSDLMAELEAWEQTASELAISHQVADKAETWIKKRLLFVLPKKLHGLRAIGRGPGSGVYLRKLRRSQPPPN